MKKEAKKEGQAKKELKDSPKQRAKKQSDTQRKKALKMLDEEIEKKSGFAKMFEAAKNLVTKQEPLEKKEQKKTEEDEESQILNKDN